MRKISPFRIYPLLCTLSQRHLLRLSVPLFPNNMASSKITTTRISHPSSSTKKSKKRYNLMIESLLSNNTSARGKNLWPPTQKWNNDLYLQENQGLQTTCSCNLCHVSLKIGQVNGDGKAAKGFMISYKILDRLQAR